MHPKAALLALHGFVLCRHSARPAGWRIKRQQHNGELMLTRNNDRPGTDWGAAFASSIDEYDVVSWDEINTLILGDLPDELIMNVVAQQ